MQVVEEDGGIVIWAFTDNLFATYTESEVHDNDNNGSDDIESGGSGSSGAFFSSSHRALNHTADHHHNHGESEDKDTRAQPLRHFLPGEYFKTRESLDLIQI